MSAAKSRPASASSPSPHAQKSIDDLDRDICRLARQMNAESYRMLLLVREFDDRFGFAKWSFKSCAEWLAWRCGISLSAAREKVRAAQALRRLREISAAFAEGLLSYSKVRALTRVAHAHDEDVLLPYALGATAAHAEKRCRQIRNVTPESAHGARRAARVGAALAVGVARRGTRRAAHHGGAADRGRRAHRTRHRLRARDRGCAFPGCERRRYLDAHHLRHWADGGATSLDNLALLCTHHHRALHEGGFRVERDASGELRFERADGRTIPRFGYRAVDFMDDEDEGPSREGFCTTAVQKPFAEVREPAAVYRLALAG